MERDLGKEFQDKKICIKVKNVSEINMLQKFINKKLFEDTTILKSKSCHLVYEKWFQKGYNLAVGKINEQVEVITVSRFIEEGSEIVSVEEFVENVNKF